MVRYRYADLRVVVTETRRGHRIYHYENRPTARDGFSCIISERSIPIGLGRGVAVKTNRYVNYRANVRILERVFASGARRFDGGQPRVRYTKPDPVRENQSAVVRFGARIVDYSVARSYVITRARVYNLRPA